MPNLKALTSVRAFAALYVGLYHMVRPFNDWGPLGSFFGSGYVGVSFFFLLSGFILQYTHGIEYSSPNPPRARDFWVARFARVYPLYALSLFFAGYVYRGEFYPLFHTFAFGADLLMLQSWSVRMVSFFSVPAWSLSAEAFFYLTFPWIAGKLRPRTLPHGVLIFVLCWAFAMLPVAVNLLVDPVGGWSEYPAGGGAHTFSFAMRRYPILLLGQFMSGIALGWIYLQRPLPRRWIEAGMWAAIAALLVTLYQGVRLPFIGLHDGMLIPLYALIVLGLCQPNVLTRLLSLKPFIILGEASYAFYLFHFAFSDFAAGAFHWHTSIAGLVPRLLVLVPGSIALHFWVERPGRRLILAWWKGRKVPAPAATATAV